MRPTSISVTRSPADNRVSSSAKPLTRATPSRNIASCNPWTCTSLRSDLSSGIGEAVFTALSPRASINALDALEGSTSILTSEGNAERKDAASEYGACVMSNASRYSFTWPSSFISSTKRVEPLAERYRNEANTGLYATSEPLRLSAHAISSRAVTNAASAPWPAAALRILPILCLAPSPAYFSSYINTGLSGSSGL